MPVPLTGEGYTDPVMIFNDYPSSFKKVTCINCHVELYECYACKCWIWCICPHKCDFMSLEDALKKKHAGAINTRYLFELDTTPCQHLFRCRDVNALTYYDKEGNFVAKLKIENIHSTRTYTIIR